MPGENERRRGGDQPTRDAAEECSSSSTGASARELRARGYERIAAGFADLAAAERLGSLREIYTTRAGEEPPEFVGQHRAWVRLCPRLRGAYKPSPDGRWWAIRRTDYEAALCSHAAPAPAPANDSVPWSPAVAMAAVRMRSSKP